jgi:hypothetical protein
MDYFVAIQLRIEVEQVIYSIRAELYVNIGKAEFA